MRMMFNNIHPAFGGWLGVVLGLAPGLLAAQEEAKPKWETTASAGITLTRGNRGTFLGTISLDTSRKWPRNEVLLGASGAYGEVDSVENQKSLTGHGQYNHLFSPRLYGGLRADALYDGISCVDYRVKLSPLLGYYLIKQAKTSMAVEAGPAVVFEKWWDIRGKPTPPCGWASVLNTSLPKTPSSGRPWSTCPSWTVGRIST